MATRLIDLTDEQLLHLFDERLAKALAAPREPERLLDREGLAHALSVSVKQVDRMRAQGLPTVMVGESPRFELEGVLAWFRVRTKGPTLRIVGGGK